MEQDPLPPNVSRSTMSSVDTTAMLRQYHEQARAMSEDEDEDEGGRGKRRARGGRGEGEGEGEGENEPAARPPIVDDAPRSPLHTFYYVVLG